jgi:hypothetical protein
MTGFVFSATGLYLFPSPFFFLGCGPRCEVRSCIVVEHGGSMAIGGEYLTSDIDEVSANGADEGELDAAHDAISDEGGVECVDVGVPRASSVLSGWMASEVKAVSDGVDVGVPRASNVLSGWMASEVKAVSEGVAVA